MSSARRESYINSGKPFPNEFTALEAVRVTEARRATVKKKRMADQADAYLPAVFEKIAATAQLGGGRIYNVLPASCPRDIQIIVMDYLTERGYEAYPDETGGVVSWYEDGEDDDGVTEVSPTLDGPRTDRTFLVDDGETRTNGMHLTRK